MDTNKLSDVLEMALKNTYKATTEDLPLDSGMCYALDVLLNRREIPRKSWLNARDYVDDFMNEMREITKGEFGFLYKSLASFKGYDTELLQYLVWEAVIDKLRSQGK